MAPVPLLLPSVVTIALATAIGAIASPRKRAPSAFVAPLAGVVPALLAFALLDAPLGDLLRAPLLAVAFVMQLAIIIGLAWLPLATAPRRAAAVAGLACAMSVATLAGAFARVRSDRSPWASPDECSEELIGGQPVFDGDVTIRTRSVGEQTPVKWGPFTCFADIALKSGATRTQPLRDAPRQISGAITCPMIGATWCRRARILVVEENAYRGDDLSPAPRSFAGNLSAFGPPGWYVHLASAAAFVAIAACIIALRRLPPRTAERELDRPTTHPYRENEVEAQPDRLVSRFETAAFIATAVAFAGAAPLAVALLIG